MRSSIIAGAAACALLLGAAPTPAQAERSVIAAPSATEAVQLSAFAPSAWPGLIVVARLNFGSRRANDGWWRSNGYRPVTVYYVDGRYYDRWDDRYRGHSVRRVVVYRRGDRLYRDWDDDDRGYQNDDRGRGRYDNRDDRRYDDRHYDDRRYDDRNHGRSGGRSYGRDR
jgi:hypothetical protein